MTIKQFLTLLTLGSAALATNAAETIGGSGIGYTARIVFEKADAQSAAQTVMIKTGDNITPGFQQNSKITQVIVPTVKSSGWCDPLANPNKTTSDFAECYGWGMYSQWFLLDLNLLKIQKMKNVWVQIVAKRYDDGQHSEVDSSGIALPSDDDLVPALTVWHGQQIAGKFGDWYPNQFQGFDSNGAAVSSGFKPFWAPDLTPLNAGSTSPSWATATTGDGTSASVIQNIKLLGKGQDYLTVAVSGDARQALQHNANVKLLVKLSTKQPTGLPTEPADNGSSGGLDSNGCSIGVTCWHPQMNHCMDIPACEEPQYKGECLCPVSQ